MNTKYELMKVRASFVLEIQDTHPSEVGNHCGRVGLILYNFMKYPWGPAKGRIIMFNYYMLDFD